MNDVTAARSRPGRTLLWILLGFALAPLASCGVWFDLCHDHHDPCSVVVEHGYGHCHRHHCR